MYTLVFQERLKKVLAKVDKSGINKLGKFFSALQLNPHKGEALKGDLLGFYKGKLPPWRVFYTVNDATQEIMIWHVGLRDRAYKDFKQYLKSGRQ